MNISRKHYIIGGIVIALAFIIQPFSLLFVQTNIAPVVAEMVFDQNPDGTVSVEGETIDPTNLKLKGNAQAQIYLVEFSDYECPFCGRFHNTPKEIVEQSGGKVAWAWKHFPLTQIHPHAEPAAVAAECVFKLGGNDKFWAYTDVLIANQAKLSDALYKTEATKLGINANNFSKCLTDGQASAVVQKEMTEGTELGISGTPNTYVVKNENGQLVILETINGALPKDTVEAIISRHINED